MLLTIDVGNTQTVYGLFEGEEIVDHWRVATDPRRTSDELSVMTQGLLNQHPTAGKPGGLTGLSICSTVPSVLHEMRDMSRRHYGDVPTVMVEPGVKTGVPILVDNPKEVGADRIMNALAAHYLYDGPVIVVDFGTADVVRRGVRQGRVPRRRYSAGHRDIGRGARDARQRSCGRSS